MKKKINTDRIFNILNVVFLCTVLAVTLYPILMVAGMSFNEGVNKGISFIPRKFSLNGYRAVLGYKAIWSGYINSFIYLAVGTTINLAFTIAAAYPLSRKDLAGKNVVMSLLVFTMYFSGGLIPTYLLVRDLNMIDTIWAMVIPGAMSVYNVIIARTYFANQLPDGILEAAQIDGCGNLRFLWKIVIPLSKPILAVLLLYYAVGHWNSYFSAVIYLKSAAKYPLQIVLRDILILNQIQSGVLEGLSAEDLEAIAGMRELMKYALTVVSCLPLMVLYPFVQKHFVKGVMIGAVKG